MGRAAGHVDRRQAGLGLVVLAEESAVSALHPSLPHCFASVGMSFVP
jgi:hypothetical protein